MEITLENVIAVVTVISLLAGFVERGVELFRPLWMKITVPVWQNTAKMGAAIILGFGLSFLLKLDPFAMLGLPIMPVWGYLFAGSLASSGASGWHAILEWLKTIKKPSL